jgi:NitT/TauT family transport system permease protein
MGGEFLLPGPVHVWEALIGIATAEVFWKTALLSVGRMFFGIFLGALLGVALAVLTAANRWCDLLLSPAVKVVRAVPVASFILLVLLWVRRDWVPVAIAALMVLPVIWGAVRQGIDTADRQLLELTRCYRFDRGKTLRLFWVPSIAPAFTTGLATAMGLAWKAGVAAEVLCQPKFAIGTQIYRTKYQLETPELFAWTLVVILLSLLMEKMVKWLLERGRAL